MTSWHRVWHEVGVVLAHLGQPQHRLPPVIHITGTNGKGSVAAFLTAIMKSAGYRVHRLTSPHLWDMTERIMLEGRPIERAWLDTLIHDIQAFDPHLPFPCLMTVAAFCAFAQVPADVVIVEVGIGGHLDSTNHVTTTCLSVITGISMDHQAMLGPTLADIAEAKSGIMRPLVPCVSSPQELSVQHVLAQHAKRTRSPLWMGRRDWHVSPWHKGLEVQDTQGWAFQAPSIALRGAHQLINAATAIMAAHVQTAVPVSCDHLAEGIAGAVWPGRLQRLSDEDKEAIGIMTHHDVWLDGAHNDGGFLALSQWIQEEQWHESSLPLSLVVGMKPCKHSHGLWRCVAPLVKRLWIVESWGHDQGQRACEMMADAPQGIKHPESWTAWSTWTNVQEAINASPKSRWIVCGSLYLVGFLLGQCHQRLSHQALSHTPPCAPPDRT